MCPQVSDLYDPRTQWASYIINAIKAKELFVKDVNYIVKKDEVRADMRRKVSALVSCAADVLDILKNAAVL
jgi:hypothetical protein